MADLASGRSFGRTESFAVSKQGVLLVANGLDPVLRWDGQSTSMESAGVVAPTVTPVVVGEGKGKLLGPYRAYVRWQDKFGNWSDLSPVAEESDAVDQPYLMGHVQDATNASPIVLTTSKAHGLSSGNPIRIYGVTGNTSANADYFVSVLTSTTVALYQDSGLTVVTTGNGAYTGGGRWAYGKISGATNASPIEITFVDNHGLSVSNAVRIRGVEGNTAANGYWQVASVPTSKKITLYYSVGNGTFSTGSSGNGTGIGGATVFGSTYAFGQVVAASNTTPIYIQTDRDHGMSTGCRVRIQGVTGNEAANGDWTITRYDSTHFWIDGSAGSGTHTAGIGIWLCGSNTIKYLNVEAPTDSKVVRRQILRNTSGQNLVYYVDVDTTDLTSTTFTSTKTDEELAVEDAVDIATTLGYYALPPSDKSSLALLNERMYAAGIVDYSAGHVKVTSGSPTVTGVGTAWTSSMEGRYLHVVGSTAPTGYLISDVDTANQTLTLSENYDDSTDKFAMYAIRPAPATRKTVKWTLPGSVEAWSEFSAFSIDDDGDEITGLLPFNSFLYVLERGRMYKFSAGDDPATDGGVFPAVRRGCVNNRCWKVADDMAYLLDSTGVYRFGGGRQAESISDAIATVFWNSDSKWRIQWQHAEYFHASHDAAHKVIRWFVTLGGGVYPRHALCFSYLLDRWWLEEYRQPIMSSCEGEIGWTAQPMVGSEHGKVFALWQGVSDVANQDLGTCRGTITSAGIDWLADSTATFPSQFVNAPISIVAGLGKGQQRKITSISGTTVYVDVPWTTRPDTTSTYQIGGVAWQYRGRWHRLSKQENDQPRRIEVAFKPTASTATMDMRIRTGFSEDPVLEGVDRDSRSGEGVSTSKGSADNVIDLTKPGGVVQKLLNGHKEYLANGARFLQLELAGTSNRDVEKVYQISMDGFISPVSQ